MHLPAWVNRQIVTKLPHILFYSYVKPWNTNTQTLVIISIIRCFSVLTNLSSYYGNSRFCYSLSIPIYDFLENHQILLESTPASYTRIKRPTTKGVKPVIPLIPTTKLSELEAKEMKFLLLRCAHRSWFIINASMISEESSSSSVDARPISS